MKYYIIAGEASGDMHAANLMAEIKLLNPNASFRFYGGDKMLQESPNLFKHYKNNDFMGFWEVIVNIKKITQNLKAVKQDILNTKVNHIILVDYPGFNLRIAKFAKQNNITTHFYISPKIWAWKEKRVKKIKKYIDYMYCIFPFEVAFYKKHHYPVYFVGNPLLDQIKNYTFKPLNFPKDKKLLALLPGSRKSELKRMLPIMLKVAHQLKDFTCVIAGAPSIDDYFYKQFDLKDIPVLFNATYEILHQAHLALVTSGTATLETALFKVPQVVCYRTSKVTYHIIKNLITIKFISLVNIILNKNAVPELIQDNMNTSSILQQIQQLKEGEARDTQLANYEELTQLIGNSGASKQAAQLILKHAQIS